MKHQRFSYVLAGAVDRFESYSWSGWDQRNQRFCAEDLAEWVEKQKHRVAIERLCRLVRLKEARH